MPTFIYKAMTASGSQQTGEFQAASPEQAIFEIKARGLYPVSLIATRSTVSGTGAKFREWMRSRAGPWGRPGRREVVVFTRQLATLLHAGVPLLRALEVLSRQERKPGFKSVLDALAENIRAGQALSQGMQQHPQVFDRLYLNMVKAGETGGVLDVVLDRLAGFLEKSERIKGRVKSAMMYPALVLCLAGGILAALMTFVVPRFEQIFHDLLKGAPLPVLTQGVLNVSNFIKSHFVVTLGLIAAAWLALKFSHRTAIGARIWDGIALRLPPVGGVFQRSAIARFSRTLGTLLSSGVPILPSLLITGSTSGNVLIEEAVTAIHDRVKEGDGVAGPLKASPLFPPMVASMVQVGEETGALPEMLTRIADRYEEEVDNAVAALTSMLEPIMIVFLALIVGTLVIALFLPIVGIIQHLGG